MQNNKTASPESKARSKVGPQTHFQTCIPSGDVRSASNHEVAVWRMRFPLIRDSYPRSLGTVPHNLSPQTLDTSNLNCSSRDSCTAKAKKFCGTSPPLQKPLFSFMLLSASFQFVSGSFSLFQALHWGRGLQMSVCHSPFVLQDCSIGSFVIVWSFVSGRFIPALRSGPTADRNFLRLTSYLGFRTSPCP